MKIIRSFAAWPQAAHGSVMALGNFDGMHKGHQAVLAAAKQVAKAEGRPLSVMTFEPHPRRFFKPSLPILRIVPFAEKARLLKDAGVDYLYVARFNKAFSEITADQFVSCVLLDELKVAHVVTGYNFSFGHRRGGNADFLGHVAERQGFGYTRMEAVASENAPEGYASTAIRYALEHGDVAAASRMLGRPYGISGTVIHGMKRGSQLGFPTANIRPSPLFLPQRGVYAVRLHLPDGRVLNGVANLGVRPTVDHSAQPACLLEVHAFGLHEAIYGQHVRVTLESFIRPEQKFDGIDALKAQIAKDSASAMQLLGETAK